ncbi:hypothetical protein GCM10025734_34410 [Kitasatospora paranensis]
MLGKAGVLVGVLVVLGLLYEVLPTSRTGQTFGKRLARVRVVDARAVGTGRSAKGGKPANGASEKRRRRGAAAGAVQRQTPPFGRALVRWAVGQVAVLVPIGLLWPLLDRRARRGWHDRAARTRVVKA